MNSKAELDGADEGGEPLLDANYPPAGEPLYWEEFKEWAAVNILAASRTRSPIQLCKQHCRATELGVPQPAMATLQVRKGWWISALGRQPIRTSGHKAREAKRSPSMRT